VPIPTKPAPEGRKYAISYVRFSSKMQIGSDSERRQAENTERYCEQHGLILVKEYDFRDLGKSAYTGAHVKDKADKKGKKPGLARFFELCAKEEIPRGWALVVEAFDRLSRQDPYDSISMLSQIRNYGIEIHFVMTGMVIPAKTEPGVFRPDQHRDDTNFVIVCLEALQSHNYSKKLAERLREAFKTKREKAMAGLGFVSQSLPWWLEFKVTKSGERKIGVVPERGRIVKKIYEWTAAGWSSLRIARKLNADKVPTWRPQAKQWLDTRIRDLIRFDTAQGVLVPTPKARTASSYGPALDYRIEGYYPQVVAPELAAKARAALRENTVGLKKHSHPPDRPHNLFRGLLRHKGRWCRFQCRQNGKPGQHGKTWHGYYDDHSSSDPDPTTWSIAANQLEPVVIAGLIELKPTDLVPLSVSKVKRSIALRKEVTEVERQMKNLADTIAMAPASGALAAKMQTLEFARAEMQKELAGAEAKEAAVSPNRVGAYLKALSLDLKNPEVRLKTTEALYRLIERIDVADDLADLPVTGIAQDVDRLEAQLKMEIVEDPYPIESKRRRLFSLLITFRGGGQRLILRTSTPFLISARYQPNPLRSPDVEKQFRKEEEEWEALSEREKKKRLAEIKKNRDRLRA